MVQAKTKCPPKVLVTKNIEAWVLPWQAQNGKLSSPMMVAVAAKVALQTSSMMVEANCPPTAFCSKLSVMLTLNHAKTVLVMKNCLSWTLCRQ